MEQCKNCTAVKPDPNRKMICCDNQELIPYTQEMKVVLVPSSLPCIHRGDPVGMVHYHGCSATLMCFNCKLFETAVKHSSDRPWSGSYTEYLNGIKEERKKHKICVLCEDRDDGKD